MKEMIISILPLGLGITLSPEVLILGLWLASLKDQPTRKAWMFCASGMFGLAIFFTVGLVLGNAAGGGPSMTRFLIRAIMGGILIATGFYTLIKGHKHLDHNRFADRANLRIAAVLGLIVTVANLKAISIALAAGHQVFAYTGPIGGRIIGSSLFFALCLIPFALPALLDTIKPGLVAKVMAPCNTFLTKHGKWVGAAICFLVGGIIIKGAITFLP